MIFCKAFSVLIFGLIALTQANNILQQEEIETMKKCELKPEDIEQVDLLFAYTEQARDYISSTLCEDSSNDRDYIKRYINRIVEDTNEALAEACVKFRARIVHVREWPSSHPHMPDETTLNRVRIHEIFGNNGAKSIFTTQDVDDYGADGLVLFYLRDSGWNGGGNGGRSFIVPLQWKIRCGFLYDAFGIRQEVQGADWFIYATEFGNYLGAADNTCGKVHSCYRTVMSDPDLPEDREDFCKPRKLEFTKECAKVINESENSLYMGHRRDTQIGDCATLLQQINDSNLGDGYCDDDDVQVPNASGNSVTIEYNSAICGWDNGDCCEQSCVDGSFTCGANDYECIDPEHVSDLCMITNLKE